ncbi:hypothetical protein [Roseisalinus antarcticus]|uniref:Uncharacterized protein n=1 Tax=Roseisalinus antarcticus TaxID=254357 RepID=A0A1Y5RIP0_9RHOB|nr:hypothetical protein [Roseisalinus antarcticus]SLN18466.1 hypothetical protein ROA7023_00394 [Roseisalinus antarcticus]
MSAYTVFLMTLWLSLFVIWIFSGEQFLDLMFAMPNAGPIDDVVLTGVVGLEEARASWGAPDLFRMLRDALHGLTGLGG